MMKLTRGNFSETQCPFSFILFLLLPIVILLVTLPYPTHSKRHHENAVGNGVQFSPENRLTCVYENDTFEAGERFRPDPCTFCRCPRQGGRPRCAVQDCYREPSCVRYHKPEDECCGVCVQFGCLHSDGKSYPPGALVRNSACETCRCPESGGRTVCDKVPCPPVTCVNPIKVDGSCCLTCPTGSNCLLGTRLLRSGVSVRVSRCKDCFCAHHPASRTAGRLHQPPRAVCTTRPGCT